MFYCFIQEDSIWILYLLSVGVSVKERGAGTGWGLSLYPWDTLAHTKLSHQSVTLLCYTTVSHQCVTLLCHTNVSHNFVTQKFYTILQGKPTESHYIIDLEKVTHFLQKVIFFILNFCKKKMQKLITTKVPIFFCNVNKFSQTNQFCGNQLKVFLLL